MEAFLAHSSHVKVQSLPRLPHEAGRGMGADVHGLEGELSRSAHLSMSTEKFDGQDLHHDTVIFQSESLLAPTLPSEPGQSAGPTEGTAASTTVAPEPSPPSNGVPGCSAVADTASSRVPLLAEQAAWVTMGLHTYGIRGTVAHGSHSLWTCSELIVPNASISIIPLAGDDPWAYGGRLDRVPEHFATVHPVVSVTRCSWDSCIREPSTANASEPSTAHHR